MLKTAGSKRNIRYTKSGSSKENLVKLERLVTLQGQLYNLWEIHKIDKAIQDAFMKSFSILSPKAYIQVVSEEVKNLSNGNSITQKLILSIKSREECIKELHEINKEDTEIKAKLEKLRMTSLTVVENAMKLKEQLNKAYRNIKVPILYEGKNYLVEMKNDIKFLKQSFEVSDTFLLSLSKPFGGEGRGKMLAITSVVLERIKKAENFLMNECILTGAGKENKAVQKNTFSLQDERVPMNNYIINK